MTINLTPNSTADDFPGVVEVIKLLSDPDAYNAKLAELRGLAASADSKLADAKALADKYAAATTMVADATRLLTDHKRRGDEITDRTNTLNARERAHAKAESEHDARVAAAAAVHTDREQAVSAKEAEVERKLTEISKWGQALKEREAIIEQREAKMKEIARSFQE